MSSALMLFDNPTNKSPTNEDLKSGVLSVSDKGVDAMLTDTEKKLHAAVVECAKDLNRGQKNMIRFLIRVETSRYYRKMNRRNLSEFIQHDLHIDSTYTYELVRVTKTALQFPALAEALNSGRLGSSHASRIVSTINQENAAELVDYATHHSFRQVEEYVAKTNPKRCTREMGKWISEDQFRVSIVLSKDEYELMKSVQDGEAQCRRPAKMKDAVVAGLKDYVERRDKVKKAERAAKRSAAPPVQTTSVKKVTLQNVRTQGLRIKCRSNSSSLLGWRLITLDESSEWRSRLAPKNFLI